MQCALLRQWVMMGCSPYPQTPPRRAKRDITTPLPPDPDWAEAYTPTPLPTEIEERLLLPADTLLSTGAKQLLTFPNSISLQYLPDGALMLCSPKDTLLARFDQGRLTRTWQKRGQGPGDLLYPGDLTLDAEGNLLVLDRQKFHILRFSPHLDYLGEWAIKLCPLRTFWHHPRHGLLLSAGSGPQEKLGLWSVDTNGSVKPFEFPTGTLPGSSADATSLFFLKSGIYVLDSEFRTPQVPVHFMPWDGTPSPQPQALSNPGSCDPSDFHDIMAHNTACISSLTEWGGGLLWEVFLGDWRRFVLNRPRCYTAHYYTLQREGQDDLQWISLEDLIPCHTPQGPTRRVVFLSEEGDLKEWVLKDSQS